MSRPMQRTGPWLALAAAAALVAVASCDQDSGGFLMDSAVDVIVDWTGDTPYDPGTDPGFDPGVDPGADPGTDPGTDPGVDTGPCDYPAGPYAFNAVGNTVGPMNWPSAVAGTDETGIPDFEALHCDEGVNSIFIQVLSTT